jgi:hypothetical protein
MSSFAGNSEHLWLPAGTHSFDTYASLSMLIAIRPGDSAAGLMARTRIRPLGGGTITETLAPYAGTALDILRLDGGGGRGSLRAGAVRSGAQDRGSRGVGGSAATGGGGGSGAGGDGGGGIV